MCKYLCLILVAVMVAGFLTCGKNGMGEFKKEINLVIKAGKDQLTPRELEDLRKQNHPILIQIGDPNTKKLLALFANLPQSAHNELLEKGYLKWKFADLDKARQQIYQDLIQVNIDLAKQQGAPSNPDFSLEALNNADVGFARVDIEETKQKVVSCIILWPMGQPTWVTMVGVRACGTQPYFKAHLNQLATLRGMPYSTPLAGQ